MLRDLVGRTACAAAAMAIALPFRPRYKPAALHPESEAIGARVSAGYASSIEDGHTVTRKIVSDSKVKTHDAKISLTFPEIRDNLRTTSGRFDEIAGTGDPDALAVRLVEAFCIGIPGMADFNNRRRVVGVWSALLAPSVVMRELRGRPITLKTVVDCGVDWIAYGCTRDAQDAYAERKSRFISGHPARTYQLISDAAAIRNVDHEGLMRSVIDPVLMPIGYHFGALGALDDIERESERML